MSTKQRDAAPLVESGTGWPGGETPTVSGARTYTIEQVAEILQCSRATTYELIRRGELQSIKVGALRRVTDVQLRAYLSPPAA